MAGNINCNPGTNSPLCLKKYSTSTRLRNKIYSEAQVEAALDMMAETINTVLAESNPLVLCVLNGGIIATGKLITRLTMPLTLDSINATRYQNQTSGGTIHWGT